MGAGHDAWALFFVRPPFGGCSRVNGLTLKMV
jgi:hypothetical protein